MAHPRMTDRLLDQPILLAPAAEVPPLVL